MGENHMGISLQSAHVALAEFPSPFCREQQEYGFVHQRIDTVTRQRFFRVKSFIHRNDQLGNRAQPGEPRITGK